MKLKEFIDLPFGEILFDWEDIEDELEMELHENIKKFYSKIENKAVKSEIKFTENLFLPTGNDKFDSWLLNEDITKYPVIICFHKLPKHDDSIIDYIEGGFESWTGGNDFGDRLAIGEFMCNIGQILITINNDTGNIEWVDCGYGYFEEYEENPHGILANSIEEFLENLKANIVK